MSTLAHDFKEFARYFPSMPIHWIALHYAKRHLKSHQRIPPDMAFMLTSVLWADKKYSDSQPRIPAGSPGGGQWTSEDSGGGLNLPSFLSGQQDQFDLANITYICTLSGRGITYDTYGNPSWFGIYDCLGGQSIRREGIGSNVPGFILDPFFGTSDNLIGE